MIIINSMKTTKVVFGKEKISENIGI